MINFSETFPCLTCREHIKEYLANNSMEAFWGPIYHEVSGEDIGLFKWTWIFHNVVNARLAHWGHAKKQMDFDTAYDLYYHSDNTTCSLDCGH